MIAALVPAHCPSSRSASWMGLVSADLLAALQGRSESFHLTDEGTEKFLARRPCFELQIGDSNPACSYIHALSAPVTTSAFPSSLSFPFR